MSRPQIALITGASRGIGLSVARALAGRGMRLALTARDPDRLTRVTEKLRAEGADAWAFPADLLDPDACKHIVAATRESLGPPDILVNNAGRAPSARVEDTEDSTLDEALTLQVRSPLRLIQGVLTGMRERQSGCIVQVASTAGLRGFSFTSAYTAAKHGMVGLTRALAEELSGTGIRIYAVCPGFVDTDLTREAAAKISAGGKSTEDKVMRRFAAMNTIGRMLHPGEVAEAIAWLCTDLPEGCVYNMDRSPPVFV